MRRPSLNNAIISAGSLGGLLYGANFASQLLIPFAGSGATGLVTGMTVPFVLAFGSRLNRRFGTVTTIWIIYCTLAIPTALMGPPGAYKPLLGLFGGLAYDAIFVLCKRKAWGLYIAMIGFVATLAGGFFLALQFSLMSNVEFDSSSGTIGGVAQWLLVVIAVVFLLEGCFSTYLANRVYEKRFEKRYG